MVQIPEPKISVSGCSLPMNPPIPTEAIIILVVLGILVATGLLLCVGLRSIKAK